MFITNKDMKTNDENEPTVEKDRGEVGEVVIITTQYLLDLALPLVLSLARCLSRSLLLHITDQCKVLLPVCHWNCVQWLLQHGSARSGDGGLCSFISRD